MHAMIERNDMAKKTGSGAERRRHPRANCELPITLSIDGVTHEAKLRDVSRAGVCFYLERPIALMTALRLALDLPIGGATKKIRGQGAVVRCERISPTVSHWEIAVFLHDLSESDRALLDLHVKSQPVAR
jgi:hypothetical protein